MKKPYTKPDLICQELHPETLLCACTYRNPIFNELQQCGYTEEDMDVMLFAETWASCEWVSDQYCYQMSTGTIFSS